MENQSEIININSFSTDTLPAELFYKDKKIDLKIPYAFLKENINFIMSEENLQRFLNKDDFEKLAKFLPPQYQEQSGEDLTKKFFTPIQTFKNMLDKKYFTKEYQKNLEILKINGIEEYIKILENKAKHIKENMQKYMNIFLNNEIKNMEEDEINEEYNINEMNIFNPDLHSEMASSGYTTLSSDEEENINENIEKNNNEEIEEKTKENETVFEGSLSDERFKNLKTNKNQLTIKQRSKEEIQEFQKQELERYKNPHMPWTYFNSDGSASVVAPVLKKIPSGSSSKPRDHVMLKSDRPSYVTILCLARDAGSRLPEGVGTRADICDLLKDSQYINERLSDSQINNIISGALDRLHYEKDPCVKYDLSKKLWIYLHRNRSVDYPPWNEYLKKSETKVNQISITSEHELNQEIKNEENHSIKDVKIEEDLDIGSNIVSPSSKISTTPKKSKKINKMLKQKRKHS